MKTIEEMPVKQAHEGRNLKRLREILHIKQDVLADALGVSQQSVSLLEQKETLDPETLKTAAKALGISPEAIKNFSEEATVTIISNTFRDTSSANGIQYHYNPIDKIVQLYEEKLAKLEKEIQEKNTLIERLFNK
jgi:transcriptional regulator with XRE-family HTH domain